jgi:hypothetical protein
LVDDVLHHVIARPLSRQSRRIPSADLRTLPDIQAHGDPAVSSGPAANPPSNGISTDIDKAKHALMTADASSDPITKKTPARTADVQEETQASRDSKGGMVQESMI